MEANQAPPAPLTGTDRKRLKDLTRKRGGKMMKKRLHVLNNPAKLAFRGWEDEPEPWKYSTCEEYIEWCHITKQFPHERHRYHRHSDKANLTHCLNAAFVERCIEVYQFLYKLPHVERNEAPLFICRMVYAEVVLHKVVDWTTIKFVKSITMPTERDIPRRRIFPDGGLGRALKLKPNDREYRTDESEPDSDSDGARGRRAPRRAATQATMMVMEPNQLPVNNAPQRVDEHVEPVDNIIGVQVAMEAVAVAEEDMVEGQPVVVEIIPTIVEGVPFAERGDRLNEIDELRNQLAEKDGLIAQLQETIQNLMLESATKDTEILNLRNALQQGQQVRQVRSSEPTVVDDAMEVDDTIINNVIDTATIGVLEDIRTPAKRRRVALVLPPMGPFARPYVDIDGPLSQDSLSFPTSAESEEVNALRNANDTLRLRVSALSETYYQWKVATILSIDRGRQMAMEFKKVDNEYLQHNVRRDFGLTSWANSDDLFPSDLPTQSMNPTLIDWAKLDFDHANASSCHDLQMKPGIKGRKLWPNPAPWILDGTKCAVCYNPFGPEGGWALGSCQCMFHPMCLISMFLVRRFCPCCKSPFHERLYEVFGLTPYMPPSHERNPENTPGEGYRNQWGEDLIWSWRANTHSVFKNDISAMFGWEHNHEEIVRVCEKIIGSAPTDQGKRNFFYQTLDGYWDSQNNRFQFGQHPQGLIWNKEGRLITDHRGNADMDSRIAVQMDLSEWKEQWKKDAVDYLLDEHSPGTLRILEELRNSQMLRNLTIVDGPFQRTRTRARRSILLDDGAGPSGTAGVDEDE